MKVIALSGWKYSGKDTAAEYLVNNYDYLRVSFADPLKDRVAEEYEIPREFCDDPKLKEEPILYLPVVPKDDFSLKLSKILSNEFRTKNGYRAEEVFLDTSETFLGLLNGQPQQLYWTPRALCILKGSVNRSVRVDYWVQSAIKKIKNSKKSCIITDLRYRSELTQLKQAFGKDLISIRIERFDSSSSLDASEIDLDNTKFDFNIENKGTLEEFIQKIEELKNDLF